MPETVNENPVYDARAFGVLVRATQVRLRGFLLRLCKGNGSLADDLVQETYLEAWRNIAAYKGEGAFGAWLHAIAYSRFLKHLRKSSAESLSDEEDMPAPAVSSEAKIDIERAFAQLSVAERAALTLCYSLEFSHTEAAAILALPLGTVKSHIARGREKLARHLQDWRL